MLLLLWATHTTEKEYQELWKDLFQLDTKVGSLSPWEPRVYNQTNLNIRNRQEIVTTWPFALTDKAVPERKDLKQGYIIPACNDGSSSNNNNQSKNNQDRRLTIQPQEPNLKWIGLDIDGPNLHMYISGDEIHEPLLNVTSWARGLSRMAHFFSIRNTTAVADEHDVSFCFDYHDTSNAISAAYLNWFIGVSVPSSG
jgi:hypothetical protein